MATTQGKKPGTAKKPTTKKPATTKKKPQEAPEMPEDIWEQLPGETADHYTKFCLYRDMAYDGKPEQFNGKDYTFGRKTKKRSLQKLADELGLKSKRPVEQLSVKYDWGARCEAYDLDLERRIRQAHESAILKMTEDHALLGAQMIRKAMSRLLKIPEDEISASDLVRLADVGVKIERLSRGESTENQSVSGSVAHKGTVKVSVQTEHDLSDLSDKELDQLEQLLGKVHSKPGV